MTSGGNNFNYFYQNELNKFSASSLNNKSKQGRRNKFKNENTNNLPTKQAEKFLNFCMQNCHINFKNSQHFGAGFEPVNPPLNTALGAYVNQQFSYEQFKYHRRRRCFESVCFLSKTTMKS